MHDILASVVVELWSHTREQQDPIFGVKLWSNTRTAFAVVGIELWGLTREHQDYVCDVELWSRTLELDADGIALGRTLEPHS